jgi:hypothetical protein
MDPDHLASKAPVGIEDHGCQAHVIAGIVRAVGCGKRAGGDVGDVGGVGVGDGVLAGCVDFRC